MVRECHETGLASERNAPKSTHMKHLRVTLHRLKDEYNASQANHHQSYLAHVFAEKLRDITKFVVDFIGADRLSVKSVLSRAAAFH